MSHRGIPLRRSPLSTVGADRWRQSPCPDTQGWERPGRYAHVRLSQLRRRSSGSPMRKMAVLAAVATLSVALLSVSSIVLASRQVSSQTNKRIQAAAAVSSVAVHEQTNALAALVHSYATRPSLVTDLAAGPSGDAQLDSQLTSLVVTSPRLSGAFISDLSGTFTRVEPRSPNVVGVNFAYRDWF